MAITPQQKTAITAKLSVSLSTLTDDRLIELCLLYRSAPEALPTFPALLEAEITRRFTAAEIAANDVMFSVIQNFSNQFNPELQYKEKMYEFINALDRDLWATQNVTFFENLLETSDRIAWVAGDSNLMNVIASNNLMMGKIAGSSMALSKIVISTVARNAIISNNDIFQSIRLQVYDTIKTTWVKKSGVSQSGTTGTISPLVTVNNSIKTPLGFVFATLGRAFDNSTNYTSGVKHTEGGGVAVSKTGGAFKPITLVDNDAITFDNAYFYSGSYGHVYAELWSPT